MEKQTAFFKTKWKYLLVFVIACAVSGGIGFLQSAAHSSTIENQKKQEKLEATAKDLAAKVAILEAANSESNEKINK